MTDSQIPPSLFSLQAARLALATPWKARNEIERLLFTPAAWAGFRFAGIEIESGWKCYGQPIIQKHRQSTLKIGKNANLRSSRRSNPLGPTHPCILSTRSAEAELLIGADFGMTGGAIVCEQQIIIGDRVALGANTVIVDTDFHPIDPIVRQQHPTAGATAPIHIHDDVFIGMQTLILKGVTIGSGSVIGAGSVVTRDIPAGVIVAGNPARFIRPV